MIAILLIYGVDPYAHGRKYINSLIRELHHPLMTEPQNS